MIGSSQILVRDAWAHNFDEELRRIVDLVLNEQYSVVSFDTEFPGFRFKESCVAYAPKKLKRFQQMSLNVRKLDLIQLGISLSKRQPDGAYPISWQFNLRYNLTNLEPGLDYDTCAISMLERSGIDFDKLSTDGIEYKTFGKLLAESGLLENKDILWITFFGMYDYGYLLKYIVKGEFPDCTEHVRFFQQFQKYFPCSFDTKLFQIAFDELYKLNSLQAVADHFGCKRLGEAHQAGSDSRLTLDYYWAVVSRMAQNCGVESVALVHRCFGNWIFRTNKNLESIFIVGFGFHERSVFRKF